MKLGRNEKCWCRSGLKFKRCHEGREREKSISMAEVIAFDLNVSKRKTCYAPKVLLSECNNIIKAYTVSKSSGLVEIADNTNHVLGLKMNLVSVQKNNGRFKFEKLGINNASTFKGFCAKHDKLLFSSFEDKPFIGTEEQCYGLTYRAIAKEIYAKEGALLTANFMRSMDKGMPIGYQIEFQNYLQSYTLGTKAAIAELSLIKENLDKRILKKEFKPYNFLVLESLSPIPIVVSSIVNPTHDFKGNFLQDLSNLELIPQYLAVNSFSSNKKGFVLFSWLKQAKIIDQFINSLLEIRCEDLFGALIRFFFSSAENSFISPDWWNNLDDIQKSKIEELFEVGADLLTVVPSDTLANNDVKFTGWAIENIYRVK